MPKSSDDPEQKSSSRRAWAILIGLSILSSLTANGGRGLLIAAGMVLVIVIIWIWRTTAQPAANDKRVTTGKAKNDDLDPLRVLSSDDIDELREEIKSELRSRIAGGTDGELSSLDALLAEQKTPEKANKR